MKNFFETPTTTALPTIKNPETGEIFTVTEVFRSLFSEDNFCHALWRNGEEHVRDQDLRDSIDFTVLKKENKWHSNFRVFDEATEEDVKTYHIERGNMTFFLLYDDGSPFKSLRENLRKLLVKNENGDKVLNIELVSKLLDFELDNGMTEYALSHRLEGKAGDWYFRRSLDAESTSCCFGDTQADSVVYLLLRTLNIYSRVAALATDYFRQGFEASEVRRLLIHNYGNTEAVIDYGMNNAFVTPEKVVVWKKHGCYAKAYVSFVKEHAPEALDKDNFRTFDTMEQARIWVEVATRVLNAESGIRIGELQVQEYKSEIADREQKIELHKEQLAAAKDCLLSVERQISAL